MTAATDKQGKIGVSRHKDKLMKITLARWPQQNKFSRMALTSKRRKAGSLLPDQEPPATLHWLLYTRVEVRVQPKTIPLFITDLENIPEVLTQPVTKTVHTKPYCFLTYFLRLLGTQKTCLVYFISWHHLQRGALIQASIKYNKTKKE